MKMKTNILFASVVLSAGLLPASAGQPNPRFDGVWVGVESTRTDGSMLAQNPTTGQWLSAGKPETMRKPAQIAITESGRSLGVIKGVSPGRYVVSLEKSGGNVLVFSPRPDGPCWAKLTLSADGNTLTETGMVVGTAQSGAREDATWPGGGVIKALVQLPITGTFHREGKK